MARKTEFDIDKSLQIITDTFWKYGFTNTSMSKIVHATGVQKASLYGVFGDKESMFIKAINHYYESSKEINMNKGITYIQIFFKRLIDLSSKESHGCLIMNSALELSYLNDNKSKVANALWEKIRKRLLQELEYSKKYENAHIEDSEKLSKWFISQAFTIRELSKISSDQDYFESIHDQIKRAIKEIRG